MGHQMTQTQMTAKEPEPGLNGVTPHREFLEDRMDPDFGLLDKLLKCAALSRKDLGRVRAKSTFQERNAELLDHIAKQHKCAELIAALRDTRQAHLVKYVEQNGKYRPGFDDWPLTEAELSIFDANQESLVDLLDPTDLISKLLANEVINTRQKDFIAAKPTPYEKNEALIEILRRRSIGDYKKTIQCLHETNQSHIAEIFESEGVVVSVHANLSDTVTDIVQAEEEIASMIAALLQKRKEEDPKRILGNILEMVDAKLIGGKVGHSVVLYFLCRTDGGLCRLRRLWTSGWLTQMTEDLFNRLLCGRDRFEVTVRWTDSDYIKSKVFFQDRVPTEEITGASNTTMYELPLELHDMILKNVCLLHIKTDGQSTPIRDKDLFSSLASVDICWFHRLKRRRFKSTLLRHIAVRYRKDTKRKTIVRTNRDYLSEMIQPKDVIVRLRRTDCLTDQQMRILSRRPPTKTMNEELLDFVRKLDVHRYSTTVECLRQKNQKLPAHVLEKGGASVKLSLLSEQMANLRLTEQQIANTFSELRDKKMSMPQSLEKLLKEIKSNDIEFMDISYDRAIAIWILCKSSNGLRNLQEAMETMTFQDDITELFRQISLSDERLRGAVRPSIVITETIQFSKEVAVCLARVKLVKKFQIPAEYVYGVTKLHDNVYILCQSPNSLAVFRGQDPFDLLETIQIGVIRKPEDIGASQKDACLYISDSGSKCIWRRAGDEQLVMWLSNVDWPFTLFVSSDGHVLIARKGQPSVMELYARDSVLLQCVSMPTDIIDPLHCVQTTTGNLVISHWWRDSVTEGVCELTRDGQVARRFIGKGKSQMLNFPRYLTLDTDDRLFVADFDDSRLVMLDSDLSWIRVLLTKEEDAIEYPERLCFDKKKKQLMVGHAGGVDLYALEFR